MKLPPKNTYLHCKISFALQFGRTASVCVKGSGGSAEPAPEPEFTEDCVVETANFVLEGDQVTLVSFAELANAAVSADVTEDMVKVYSAETLEGLKIALPLDQGVAVETKSAVKTTT